MAPRQRKNNVGSLMRSANCLFGLVLLAVALCILSSDFAVLQGTGRGSAEARVLDESTESKGTSEVLLPDKDLKTQEEEEAELESQRAAKVEELKKQEAEREEELKKQEAEREEELKKQEAEREEELKKQEAEREEELKKQEELKRQESEKEEELKRQESATDEQADTEETEREEANAEEEEEERNEAEDVEREDLPECTVVPTFLEPGDVDAPEPLGEIPDHVKEFDAKGIKLPRYPASKIYMVSVTSNNTYQRRVAQENTFGRIFDIHFVGYEHFPLCVLCDQESHNKTCHCPEFRQDCLKSIFWHRTTGWWCATRRQILAIKVALDEWTEPEFPDWIHLLDDNTFVNPVGEIMLINSLDPEVPYFIGDDWGGFLGGGCGKLLSRGLLRKLVGPAVNPVVEYIWPNGTHTVTAETQMEACVARHQGGSWCYNHGDWGLASCVHELNVSLTDVAGKEHSGFMSQIYGTGPLQHYRFNMREEWVGELLARTHSIAVHVSEAQMFEIFYNITVPFYQELHSLV